MLSLYDFLVNNGLSSDNRDDTAIMLYTVYTVTVVVVMVKYFNL